MNAMKDSSAMRYRKRNRSDDAEILALLASGALEVAGLVPWSSNYTFLVTVSDSSREALAIYKPNRGERPLWDFPTGTLSKREVAAYTLSAALGWPNIPPSVLREGPQGEGVVQLFIETVDGQHFFTLRDAHRDDMQRIAAFDAVINNTDRKGGHILLGKDGCIWCIDHGVTFHEYPKLRTVIWDFAEQPLPRDILDDLCALRARLTHSDDPLIEKLTELLSRREVRALRQRIDALVESRAFPSPTDDWPPVPWPPV
jgi:uncharacterized repeat protein (TIGR03843 family)